MDTGQINLLTILNITLVLGNSNGTTRAFTEGKIAQPRTHEGAYTETLPCKIKQLRRLSLLIVNALLVGVNIISPDNDKWLIMVSTLIFLLTTHFSSSACFIGQRQFKRLIQIHSD